MCGEHKDGLSLFRRSRITSCSCCRNIFDRMDLFFYRNYLPYASWNEKRMFYVYLFDTRARWSYECDVPGVNIKPFTIAHLRVEMGRNAAKAFVEGKNIGSYYSILAYETILDALNAKGSYREVVVAVTHGCFAVSVSWLSNQIPFSDGKFHSRRPIIARFVCLALSERLLSFLKCASFSSASRKECTVRVCQNWRVGDHQVRPRYVQSGFSLSYL